MTNLTTRAAGAPSQRERDDRAATATSRAVSQATPQAISQQETASKAPRASSQTQTTSSDQTEPRARGTPGSFDQPTPREDLMPPRGNQHPHQTAEVPLGSGDMPELPGQGGQAAQNAEEAAPYLNVNGVRSPGDEPVRGAGEATARTEGDTRADRKGGG